MVYYGAGVLIAFILGLILPHPLGLALVSGVALGGLLRLEDRVERLELLVRERVDSSKVNPYAATAGYEAERTRIQRKMAQYMEQRKEEGDR